MKKIACVLMVSLITVPLEAMYRNYARNIAHRGVLYGITGCAFLAAWYAQKRYVESRRLDDLDKEIVIRFYEKNSPFFVADNLREFQQLKQEARAGTVRWYDSFSYAPIRDCGPIDAITMQQQGFRMCCGYQYDFDPAAGNYIVARYDCTTHLSRGEIKKCIAQGIADGRID